MRAWLLLLAFSAASLGGCQKKEEVFGGTSPDRGRGRYAGVGHFPPGEMWRQIVRSKSSDDPQAAKPVDDEQVIIVVDTSTGQLRQCGNLSGFCVGLNPWSRPLASAEVAPLPVAKHADELAAEREASYRQEIKPSPAKPAAATPKP